MCFKAGGGDAAPLQMKLNLASLPLWVALAALVVPPSLSAQTTTERRTFSLMLTGYRNGAYAERYTTNRSATATNLTVNYQQQQTQFRYGNADLIAGINALKGLTNSTRATLWVNGDIGAVVVAERGYTNTIPFDTQLSMDFWQRAFAERLSGSYNNDLGTATGSATSRETWDIVIRVGPQTFNLRGAVQGNENWQYRSNFVSETSRQNIKVTGELVEGGDTCPVEGTVMISNSQTTR